MVMQLKKVTLTGADDSISPEDLLPLSDEFPFVEWGILVSYKSIGSKRFPSAKWMERLSSAMGERPGGTPNFSAHVCGRWVGQIVAGSVPVGLVMLPMPWSRVGRIQLNFHAEPYTFSGLSFGCMNLASMLLNDESRRQIILQYDGLNESAIAAQLLKGTEAGICKSNDSIVPLFDKSHGAGVIPSEWPKSSDTPQYPYFGYAGGLGPDNLPAQLESIAEAAGDKPFWIDMETKIRSDDDSIFDLDKCRTCLEACKPFIV